MIITQYIPKHKLGKLETSHCVEKTLPHLLSRTGDSSSRLRLLASTFIQVGVSLQIWELTGGKHLIKVGCETRLGCCEVLEQNHITESYHRIAGVGRTLWRSSSPTPYQIRVTWSSLWVPAAAAGVTLVFFIAK